MFSCRTRGFCPSCHAKRLEEWGEWMRETLLLDVPHRQVVFTIPKMLRLFFKYNRKLLGSLCRCDRYGKDRRETEKMRVIAFLTDYNQIIIFKAKKWRNGIKGRSNKPPGIIYLNQAVCQHGQDRPGRKRLDDAESI